ncbi:LuxR C-terminal-related transcriptional regulator [Burkholderia guangdongensis]|uniref:LuxR C-terminal-related transcriptional regulator n=1 Tax=Burkholderia guangdongensis TaxID=1792500 RepID=UPI0015CC3D83|nr:LuxR C-terminal-related transcriptional regulator [Burkholderia guangdongensis]
MISETRGAEAVYSELTLRTTPPRAPRHLLARPRVNLDSDALRDVPAIIVQAPPGFGKTLLLAQWRREHLARGAAVAWISADAHDDPQRFLHGLVLAVRVGCARPAFGRTLLEGGSVAPDGTEGLTVWLAEIAQTPLDVVLIVDEAERLSPVARAALLYLVHNAPPNLRVVIAARGGFDAAVVDLTAYGQCVCIGAESLRFRLDETMALVQHRFGERVDADRCARLHEMTDGWPLGLQLVLAAMERSADPRGVVDALAERPADEGEQLVGSLIAQLAPDDVAFLTRIAVVDMLHPDLCRALIDGDGDDGDADADADDKGDGSADADAPARLARLMRDTPIFMAGDGSDWCRLHTLAHGVLGARAAELPDDERHALHVRAMRWLAEHGMNEEAARHAHAAGERETAYDLAGRSLYDAVMQGRVATALDWLELLPGDALDRHPGLRLAAAWALALSERHGEAETLIAPILATPDASAALRYECALILSVAAYYADEPDRFLALLAPWSERPPLDGPRQVQTHANRVAMSALLHGQPANARRHLQQAPRGDFGKGHRYAARWGEFVAGLSYLREGQVVLAEDVLRPALTDAESDLGRRHPLPCMLAALLASAAYERDRVDEAAALLANRLDVLERAGASETSLLAYLSAARVAAAQGVERRALDLLEALHAAGIARALPRLCIASVAEQVRIHAGHSRAETCRALAAKLDTLVAQASGSHGPLWQRDIALLQAIAHAYAAVAAQDWPQALDALDRAQPLADETASGHQRIEILALRAFARRNAGDGHDDGRPLMQEAIDLTRTYGLARVFVDAHPALADWARGLVEEGAGGPDAGRAMPVARMPRRAPAEPRAVPSMVLTPKEREVLELLARNLSNKEIAQAIGVGEVTAKWHVKNLFGKLNASTRKHAVLRAQMLGLLEGGE